MFATYSKHIVVFALGVFAMVSQTLFFREFLTSFESDDIAVSVFFGSWFLWIAVSANFAQILTRRAAKFAEGFETKLLLYIPAFAVQYVLILEVRRMAGVAAYEIFPLWKMILWAVIVNAPVSFATGFLFPVACEWMRGARMPVSQAYVLETAGCFAGGLAVTAMLYYGCSFVFIFFCVSILAACAAGVSKKSVRPVLLLLVFFAVLLGFRGGRPLPEILRVFRWAELLPAASYEGSFQTGQTEYLYGTWNFQWNVVSNGTVCEALPDKESAGRTVAISLCQNPSARKILLVGPGLNICSALLSLPQVECVAWAHYDDQFIGKVLKLLPENLRIHDERFRPVAGDVRKFLQSGAGKFDAVIVNIPETAAAAMNRYSTVEFFALLKSSLAAGGIVSTRIASGENTITEEQAIIGASALATLGRNFKNIQVAPGETSWLIASDDTPLSGDPRILKERFAAVADSGAVFPADALLSLYLPDRAKFALCAYKAAKIPEKFLLNTDSRPLAYLSGLLLSLREADFSAANFAVRLMNAGVALFIAPIAVFLVFWALFRIGSTRFAGSLPAEGTAMKSAEDGEDGGKDDDTERKTVEMPPAGGPCLSSAPFESSVIVFCAGLTSMGTMIVLMYLFQTEFGTLYLDVGLVSSVFMAGLAAGGMLSISLIGHCSKPGRTITCFAATAFVHGASLMILAAGGGAFHSYAGFIGLFLFQGALCGTYFPFASFILKEVGVDDAAVGAALEKSDHVGAMAGAFLTGIIFVPVLGALHSLLLMGCIALMNALIILSGNLELFRRARLGRGRTFMRKAGYAMGAVALSLVACSWLIRAENPSQASPWTASGDAAKMLSLATGLKSEQARLRTAQGKEIEYLKIFGDDGRQLGYIFMTKDLAPDAKGYGGKINLSVRVDMEGRLENFEVVSSSESPAYLDKVRKSWPAKLSGQNLFSESSLQGVHAVSGATFSSEGIKEALSVSGKEFFKLVQRGAPAPPQEKADRFRMDAGGMLILLFFAAGFLASRFLTGNIAGAARVSILLCSLASCGIWLNCLYSTEQIVRLVSFRLPAPGLATPFVLLAVIPVACFLLGNYYCGYACPFGALQELLGKLVPSRFKTFLPGAELLNFRIFKYFFLFAIVVIAVLTAGRSAASWDPLVSFFSMPRTSFFMYAVSFTALLMSAFCFRFWCRFFCPAGAFLSIMAGISPFKRLLPNKFFGRCGFGVCGRRQFDCISCDRCRPGFGEFPEILSPVETGRRKSIELYIKLPIYVLGFCIAAAMARASASALGDRTGKDLAAGMPSLETAGQAAAEAAADAPPAPSIREFDSGKVKELIKGKKLSGREADFYKKSE